MQSYFSRVLHHTLSYSGLTRISRWKKFANCLNLDTPVKPECDTIRTDASLKFENNSVCTGRSMVEMLGVLAIIGVLSVGAIAGYSKAMMKYKLNKYSEQINTVINAVARNVQSFKDIQENGTDLTETFIKMGEIPTDMTKPNNFTGIYDVFGQKWRIFIGSTATTIFLSMTGSSLKTLSADNLAICQTTFTVAKENADSIKYIETISNAGTENRIDKAWFGDAYCHQSNCLRNFTMDGIYNACTAHKGVNEPIYFQITWAK